MVEQSVNKGSGLGGFCRIGTVDKIREEQREGLEGLICSWIDPVERTEAGITADMKKQADEGVAFLDCGWTEGGPEVVGGGAH